MFLEMQIDDAFVHLYRSLSSFLKPSINLNVLYFKAEIFINKSCTMHSSSQCKKKYLYFKRVGI